MRITALAGGVGGAKLADGLYHQLAPGELTVIVNTGDDFEHFGLTICPDLDTVSYTLAGLANPDTGWGRAGETWNVMDEISRLGGPGWFRLGDRDLAIHLERTRRLKVGEPISHIVRELALKWGIRAHILPMTDDRVATIVHTKNAGDLPFQDYFVRLSCGPSVTGFDFEGIDSAHPAPGVLEAIETADAVIICPSNPWVSIGPILNLPGVQERLADQIVIGVSPIIGGKALKGPAAKMYAELGITPSAYSVAQQYQPFLTGFVIDDIDVDQADAIRQSGIIPLVINTIMHTPEDRNRLAHEVLDFTHDIQVRRRSEQ